MTAFREVTEGGSSLPPRRFLAVTPSDSDDLVITGRAIRITGDAGDVKFTTVGGDTVTVPMPQHWREDVQVTRIWATGTTATGIFILGG